MKRTITAIADEETWKNDDKVGRAVRALSLLSITMAIATFAFTGCASAQQKQRQQDIKTCAKLGLPYGTSDNLQCVQRQQRQRNG